MSSLNASDPAASMSSLGDRVMGASARLEDAFQRCVGRPLGLRRSHYTVLRLVHEQPGITSGDIAKDMNVTRPCVSPVVDDLEKRGLLTRTPAPHDRRAQRLQTTPSGAELARKAVQLATEAERILLSGWSDDERHRLYHLVGRLASRGADVGGPASTSVEIRADARPRS